MRLVVCDDEPLARERLVRIAHELGYQVVAEVTTGADAIVAVKTQQPDVILLDICMPEMDGIRCAQQLQQLDQSPAIIFVTAYKKYALAALKANAVDYLLKPVNKDELVDALNNAKTLNTAQLNEIRELQNLIIPPTREYITARTHRGIELIKLKDIYYFAADQKYVKVRHKAGIVLVDETLKEIEKEFDDRFFRIHRNAIVNLKFLEVLEPLEVGQYQIRFKGIKETLAVSRRHLATLREKIQNM